MKNTLTKSLLTLALLLACAGILPAQTLPKWPRPFFTAINGAVQFGNVWNGTSTDNIITNIDADVANGQLILVTPDMAGTNDDFAGTALGSKNAVLDLRGGIATWLLSSGGNAVTAASFSPTAVKFAGALTSINGLATVGNGVPVEAVDETKTAQAAAIVTTNLLATPAAGLYKVTYYLEISQAATTSSSTQLTIGYTSAAAETQTSSAVTGNTVGSSASGSIIVHVTSGALTYAVSYSSTGATAMNFNLYLRVEAL